jgi:hypothetical protein
MTCLFAADFTTSTFLFMKHILILSCIAISFCFFSCGDDDPEKDATGNLSIEFDNVVGEDDLTLNTAGEPYSNAAGESYKVTALKYYISNIRLRRSDDFVYEDEVAVDGSKGYYLIDESIAASQHLTLENIPAGDYVEITFTIGVDANRLTEGAQTGSLDPVKGMFWSWNTGYIFVKIEGTSAASSDPDHFILYHVGGYAAPDNNIKTKSVLIGNEPAMIRNDKTPELHMIVDVNKFFETPTAISFADTPVQHSPAANKVIADNYVNTFIVDHVHN